MSVNDEISIPGLNFPSVYEVARRNSMEFQRLSPEERIAALSDILRTGDYLLRRNPKRELVEKLILKREEEWQRIQKELFRNAHRPSS